MDNDKTYHQMKEQETEGDIHINKNRAVLIDFKGKLLTQYCVDLLREVGYSEEVCTLLPLGPIHEKQRYVIDGFVKLGNENINWFDDENEPCSSILPFNVNAKCESKSTSYSIETENTVFGCSGSNDTCYSNKTSILEHDSKGLDTSGLNIPKDGPEPALHQDEHIVMLDSNSIFQSEHKVDILKEVGYFEDLGNIQTTRILQPTVMDEEADNSIETPSAESAKHVGLDDVDVELQLDNATALGNEEVNNDEDDDRLLNNFYCMDGGLPFDVEHCEEHETGNSNAATSSNVGEDAGTSESSSKNSAITADHTSTASTSTNDAQLNSEPNMDNALSSSHFSSLPYELTRKIFSFLPLRELCMSISLVCRKWNQYANDPSHWTKIIIGPDQQLSNYQLAQIIIKSPQLRFLSLHGKFDLAADELLYITRSCPQLRHLDLGFVVTIDPKGMLHISNHCAQLQSLNIEGCILVDDFCLGYMCREGCLKNLTSLNLSHCTNVTDAGLNALAEHKQKLSSLNIDGIPWISDEAIGDLCSKRGVGLKQLWLDGAEISDVGVHSIVDYCPELTLLSFSFSELLTDESLRNIKKLRCLKSLTLRKGADLSADALQSMFMDAAFPCLEKLDLSECVQLSDEVVAQLTDCCGASLTHVVLGWCWHVLDPGITHIVNKCRKLKSLDLTGLDKIGGECFSCIPEQLPNLEFLDLKQCNKIDDDVIDEVLKQVPADRLTVIDYYGNKFEQLFQV